MYCIECGIELPGHAKFCSACGISISNSDVNSDIVVKANWVTVDEMDGTLNNTPGISDAAIANNAQWSGDLKPTNGTSRADASQRLDYDKEEAVKEEPPRYTDRALEDGVVLRRDNVTKMMYFINVVGTVISDEFHSVSEKVEFGWMQVHDGHKWGYVRLNGYKRVKKIPCVFDKAKGFTEMQNGRTDFQGSKVSLHTTCVAVAEVCYEGRSYLITSCGELKKPIYFKERYEAVRFFGAIVIVLAFIFLCIPLLDYYIVPLMIELGELFDRLFNKHPNGIEHFPHFLVGLFASGGVVGCFCTDWFSVKEKLSGFTTEETFKVE